ncbi:AAA family ATPase [Lactobacillus delbrueckii]|uniref:AAA family ATPase n=1 Tax=Lactobacillus delbrueckii TaxID=1584 RepID=UPI001F254E79|nr:AAA family ATPase [Lactobacillus delbrueckii]GHN30298.1 cation transport ATPase [Lactobacillus delbrueckii]GHN51584.1 cation transport ATPase [Lactobacillus delbrueckii]
MATNYSEITVNLSNLESPLYDDHYLKFSSQKCIIFGKNGTGKTTLCKLVSEQIKNMDVRVFDGFNNLLGSDQKLNAVILGEDNVQIRKKIEEENKKLSQKRQEKEKIQENIEEPKDENIHNLWTAYDDAKKTETAAKKKYDKELTRIAASIKNASHPQIAVATYNRDNLIKELDNDGLFNKFSELSDKEEEKYKEILRTDQKTVKELIWPQGDYYRMRDQVNGLLTKKVAPSVRIERIAGNEEKTRFAQEGLRLHKPNDVCAFCGNTVTESAYEELQGYFSERDITSSQNEIQELVQKIKKEIQIVEQLKINQKDFYAIYNDQVLEVNNELITHQEKVLKWLESISDALENKNIFKVDAPLSSNVPDDFGFIKKEFEELRNKNNNDDLKKNQENSMTMLRYSRIIKLCRESKYSELKKKWEESKITTQITYQNLESEIAKIEGPGGLDEQIGLIEKKISSLQAQTKNERKLADHINQHLKNFVPFKIVHHSSQQASERGYYVVQDKSTGKSRDVTKLSSGEKNIIAFLYFIEKLDEIDEKNKNTSSRKKLIVFDDPMNSNDETMQYLIMEKLSSLMKSREGDRFIILTHNKHFYINMCNRSEKKRFLTRVHFVSDGTKTHIKYIEDQKEDFSTSYDTLWSELHFLYDSKQAPENLMLNPMRRIIETYTNFNNIGYVDFLTKVEGAKKLFDVNSHSIDDLEADMTGLDKDKIIGLFKSCFSQNHADAHFKNHWTESK